MARKLTLVLLVGLSVGLAARSMLADGPDGVPPPPPAPGGLPLPVAPPPAPTLPGRMPSPSVPASPQPAPPPPQPIVGRAGVRFLTSNAVWVFRHDTELSGGLGAHGQAFWRLAVRSNRILGGPDAPRETAYENHHISGEISGGGAAGDTPVVSLRQEGPNGYVSLHVGRANDDGRIVGTWFDNRGMSGDFELVPEHKQ